MIGNVRTPLPSLANGFARTPEQAVYPHLRRLMGVGRRGLVGSCNPCLGVQSTDIFNLGRQKKGNYSVSTVNWIQSPFGRAVVINEGSDCVLWAAADNNDFQFNDAYSDYAITLSCVVRINASSLASGILLHTDSTVSGNFYGIAIWVDESTKQLRAASGNGTQVIGVSAGYSKTANNAVTLGVWTHIVMVWGDNVTFGAPVFYVDGKAFTTTTSGSPTVLANTSTGTARIGRSGQLGGSSKIDVADWAIWNTELQDAEIAPLIADPLCYLRKRRVQVAAKATGIPIRPAAMNSYRQRRMA